MPPHMRGPVSFHDHGTARLGAICKALELTPETTRTALGLFGDLTSPWGEEAIGERPRWPSDITDDGTPYEFSLALERHRPELRMLVEAQAARPTPAAQWEAGRALNATLEQRHGAHLGRFRDIESLFAIENPEARFGMWHAANLRPGAAPDFKVYLNPECRGREARNEVVREALARLGFAGAERWLLRGGAQNELKYFSLDLSDRAEARVKVYVAHYHATCADVETAMSVAGNYIAGEVTEFCRAMAGSEGPYLTMALQSCYSFTTKGGDRPVASTLYFPVRAYAESDEAVKTRILDYMLAEDRPLYDRVLQGFADRDLDVGTGMQTYASYRRQNFFRRVTIYLSPEAYAIGPRRYTAGPVSGVMTTPGTREAQPAPVARLHAIRGR